MSKILPLILVSCTAYASTITLNSSALNTQNMSTSPTVNISPHPAWAPAFPGTNWISNAITGDPSAPGYSVIPNGSVVSFFQNFFLDGPVESASLHVLADDTSSVVVNGHMLMGQTLVGGPACAAQAIGCLMSTRGDFSTPALLPLLQPGNNTIQFDVLQVNAVSFGLDFAGTISTNPEPSTIGLVSGTGVLLFIAKLKRHRRNGDS